MSLAAGAKLGPYEIVAPIGAGGMGEVYRARDTRLDRTVAVKVLNAQALAGSAGRARFEREARVIAQLQHPNICVLHDVGQHDGTDFLVMEFLEGESLAQRLARGPLPAPELLKIATQLADALDKAHRAGVIHRDLKPGNVMLTKAGAKLLDFGLAKPMAAGAAAASASVIGDAETLTSPAPTPSLTLSMAGTMIGTVPYMSPEQVQGLEADARSDIFAFGAMLYEMATGQRAFQGKSQASVVGKILALDPPPTNTPFDRVIRLCLEKDPDERIQSAHDLKLLLEAPAETTAPAAERARPRWQLWAAAALLAVSALAAGYELAPRPVQHVYRASLLPPEGTNFFLSASTPVLSPDGSKVALVAKPDNAPAMLYVRALDSLSAQPLAGTEGASDPFWSPDSHDLGFFANGKLLRINASGGPTQVLADAQSGRGGSWSSSGQILFVPNAGSVVLQVAAAGGAPHPATKFANQSGTDRWPFFLPDGRHFLYWTSLGGTPGIRLGQLGSFVSTPLLASASNAVYANGFLLFVAGDNLMAQPFDVAKLHLTGDAFPIADQVSTQSGLFLGRFSASQSGALLYEPGGAAAATWSLAWLGRDGKPLGAPGTLGAAADYYEPAISPDGQRVAVAVADNPGHRDLWVFDLQRGTETRLTFDASSDGNPTWTPDGKQIIFSSTRSGISSLYVKPADNSKPEALLFADHARSYDSSTSADGRWLAFMHVGEHFDILGMPMFGNRKPFPVLQDQFLKTNPALSPDGRWLAYTSNESGHQQIYITSFPKPGSKWQVSTAGGYAAHWRGDGKELYFASAGAIMAVDVAVKGTALALGTPHELFRTALRAGSQGSYDVTRDGKRFLINTPAQQSQAAVPLTLVLHWTSGLRNNPALNH